MSRQGGGGGGGGVGGGGGGGTGTDAGAGGLAGGSAALSWQEQKARLAALEAVLAHSSGGGENAQSIEALRKARLELQSIFTASQCNAKRILTDLQHSVHKLQSAGADVLMPIEQLRVQTEQLDARRARLSEELGRLGQERDAAGTSMQRLLAATMSYKEQMAALATQEAADVPRRRHWLSLYANITAIRWDYDAPPGGSIEGYIAPPGGRPARPFRFETAALHGPALADALWTAVGQAHGLPPE